MQTPEPAESPLAIRPAGMALQGRKQPPSASAAPWDLKLAIVIAPSVPPRPDGPLAITKSPQIRMIAFALVEQEELDIKRLQGRLIERHRSFDIADSQNPVVEFQSSNFSRQTGLVL
jgi:hypothetical protein